MKKLLLLPLLITFFNVNAQTTAIPDANFEQALINLGLDFGTLDGVIPTANIDTLTYLDVYNQNIYSLSGIEDFTSLNILYCGSNNLTSLNVSQNIELNILHCDYNQLSNLDVTQNVLLTELVCNKNQLLNLNVNQNILLINLFCYFNQLTTLDVSQNPNLIYLSCGNNLVTSLDLSQNSSLTNLYCYFNQLSYLDVTLNPLLIELTCYGNNLTSLDLSQNDYLQYLDCSDNQLTTLDLSYLSNYRYIHCSFNQLSCLVINNVDTIYGCPVSSFGNTNLTCIEVHDSELYANSQILNDCLNNYIDSWTSISANCNNSCSTVGMEEKSLSNLSIYPNPTTGNITIYLGEFKQDIRATLTNYVGQVVQAKKYSAIYNFNFDLDVPSGIYYLKIEADGEIITKKIIKQ